MIDRQRLLADLQRLLKTLEGDLRERFKHPEVDAPVREEYERARAAAERRRRTRSGAKTTSPRRL